MVSKYFKYKTQTEEFITNNKNIIAELKNENVLVCGVLNNFIELNKKYKYHEKFNITAFADFSNSKGNPLKKFGIRKIIPEDIINESFDCILIACENSLNIKDAITHILRDNKIDIKQLFNEKVKDEGTNLDFLIRHKFKQNLPKLIKKLKGKRVLFYGGGLFFQLINEYYDLSELNAIGVVDKVLCKLSESGEICGYKLYTPEDIIGLNPDYVVVSTRKIFPIFEDLYFNKLTNTKIKLIPLVHLNFFSLIREG